MSEQPPNHIVDTLRRRVSRLFAVDALRGLIIVFMALDHANYFIARKHPPGEMWDGVYPVYTSTLAFLTRWVTHLAAPGFFLLMGVGMMLFARSRHERFNVRSRRFSALSTPKFRIRLPTYTPRP